MKNKLLIVGGICVAMLLGMSSSGFSQYAQKWANPLAPLVTESQNSTLKSSGSDYQISDTVGTAVLAALMPNAFTAQSPYSGQIYYDPYSGVIAIVHRGDLTNNPGSGYLWYASSLDTGNTWFDVGAFNPSGFTTGRHPNLAISNPNKSADPFDLMIRPVMVWNDWEADLGGNTIWRNLVRAADDALFTGSPINQSVDRDTLFVNSMTSNDQNGRVYAIVEKIDGAQVNSGGYRFYWTDDQGANWNFNVGIPPTAIDADSTNGSKIVWGPDGNTGYMLYQGVWNERVDPAREFMWGYAKTTDGGATWGSATPVPQHSIEGMPENYDFMSFYFDGIVDMNGDLHMLCYYSENGTADTQIAEIFWNGSNWAMTTIQREVNGQWILPDAGGSGLITQSEPELARNLAGDVIYAKWIDLPDTLEIFPDVYASARLVDNGAWSTPINVTQTPDVYEKMTKMAPRVTEVNDGLGTGQLHIYYSIFGDGDTNELTETQAWYLKGVTVTPGPLVGIEDGQDILPVEFALDQNYPNPFNPSTTISYSLQTSAEISLEVFSITGQRVATLVNGRKGAGQHQVTFNSNDLSSGIYFYKLTAGNRSETRKMVLMK